MTLQNFDQKPLKQHLQAATIQPLLVRVEEAAQLLSLSRSMVYELMAQKKIASISIGAARRVVVASLHAFIAEHQAQ